MAITLEINEAQIIMSTINTSGGKVLKILDPEDVAATMANQAKIETGILPANTRSYATNGQLASLLLDIKPQMRRLWVLEKRECDVPLPGCLMMLTVLTTETNKRVTGSYLYSYKDVVITPQTQLYMFPYGNVFGDGRICWGSVPIPPTPHLYQMGVIPDTFLNTHFNGHLAGSIINPFRELANDHDETATNGCQLAIHLATNNITQFPYDVLRSSQYTVKTLLKGGRT